MKTMSKINRIKLTLISFIISLFIIPSFAGAQTITIHETINSAQYDPIPKAYYLVTERHKEDNGEWYLYLFPSTNLTLEKALTESTKGSKVSIVYDDHNALNSDFWEVLCWDFEDK